MIKVQLLGVKDFNKAVDKYIRKNGDADIEKSLDKHALLTQSDAKQNLRDKVYNTAQSPNYRRTGNLWRSIAIESPVKRLVRKIGSNLTYAPFVEFGTRYMPARSFLFPAYEINRKRLVKDITRILRKV